MEKPTKYIGFTLSSGDQQQNTETGEHPHVGVEDAQRLADIMRLEQRARHGDKAEDVCGGAPELALASELQLERDADALDRHDRDGADE